MGTRLTVHARGRTYTVVEDATLAFHALVTGVAVDEVTNRGPRTELVVQTERDAAFVKTFENGTFCIAGELDRVLPDHAGTPHDLELSLEAEGYRPATLTITVPAASALPVAAPPVLLRPRPVRVQGRVVRSSTDRTPIGSAVVRVTNRPGQRLVSLRTPLHGDHPPATEVRSRRLNPTGTSRSLERPVESGARVLVLDDVGGLAPDQVVGLAWQRRLEFAKLGGVSAADREVTLTGPLTRSYAAGTAVRRFTVSPPPGPPQATRTLARDANAGDGILLLDASLPASATALQVGDAATDEVEYHSVGARADAEGFYALDGIGGVETIDLRARSAPNAPDGPAVTWAVAYGRSANVVNLQLAP